MQTKISETTAVSYNSKDETNDGAKLIRMRNRYTLQTFKNNTTDKQFVALKPKLDLLTYKRNEPEKKK